MSTKTDYERGFDAAMQMVGPLRERQWAIEQAIRTGVTGADDIVTSAGKLLKFISTSQKSLKAARKSK